MVPEGRSPPGPPQARLPPGCTHEAGQLDAHQPALARRGDAAPAVEQPARGEPAACTALVLGIV